MIIRKSNPIPVQPDGAGGTPPALGVENCSGSHPEAPAALPLGSGRKLYQRARHDRLIAPEAQNHSLDNLTDQPGTVVLIGVTIPGLGGLGKVAAPFIYRPFHAQPNSQGR